MRLEENGEGGRRKRELNFGSACEKETEGKEA